MSRKQSPLFLLITTSSDVSWNKVTTCTTTARFLRFFDACGTKQPEHTQGETSASRVHPTQAQTMRRKTGQWVKVLSATSLETQRQQKRLRYEGKTACPQPSHQLARCFYKPGHTAATQAPGRAAAHCPKTPKALRAKWRLAPRGRVTRGRQPKATTGGRG